MKRVVGYVVLGLLAYVAFLIATLPAEQALVQLKAQLPAETKTLRAAGLSGSIWSGRADVLEVAGQRLDKVRWQLKPWSMLGGKLGLVLFLDGKEIAGQADLVVSQDGTVALADVDLRLPADRLSTMFKLPVGLGGQFTVKLDNAQLQGNQLQRINGVVGWQRAAVIEPLAQTLGEYTATLTSDESGIKADVKDVSGPLQLAGEATLTPDGRYAFNGTVLVRDRSQAMLVQGVQALGRPGADGRVPIKYSGRL